MLHDPTIAHAVGEFLSGLVNQAMTRDAVISLLGQVRRRPTGSRAPVLTAARPPGVLSSPVDVCPLAGFCPPARLPACPPAPLPACPPAVCPPARISSHPDDTLANLSTMLQVTNDPATISQLSVLVQTLVMQLLDDAATLDQLTKLLQRLLAQQYTYDSLVLLLNKLLADPAFLRTVSTFAGDAVASEYVTQQAVGMANNVVHSVLNDVAVQDHASRFVQNTLADNALQKQGGSAMFVPSRPMQPLPVVSSHSLVLLPCPVGNPNAHPGRFQTHEHPEGLALPHTHTHTASSGAAGTQSSTASHQLFSLVRAATQARQVQATTGTAEADVSRRGAWRPRATKNCSQPIFSPTIHCNPPEVALLSDATADRRILGWFQMPTAPCFTIQHPAQLGPNRARGHR